MPAPATLSRVPERETSRRNPFGLAAAAAVAGTLLGGLAVFLGMNPGWGADDAASSPRRGLDGLENARGSVPSTAATLGEERRDGRGGGDGVQGLVAAVDQTRDSVVNIKIGDGFRGAGVVYDADGHMLTNYHVVAPAIDAVTGPWGDRRVPQVVARFSDGRERVAELVTSDASEDIAVFRILADGPNEGFQAATVGNSSRLRVGQQVFAVGCPAGLEHTVASGIVSAVDRMNVLPMPVLQLDAAINLGNSGGPLFNLSGELVGITTARSNKADGIGFAIPIDRVRRFMRAILGGDGARSGVIGVELDTELDISVALEKANYKTGVGISDVSEAGPGRRAGLRIGDIIVETRHRRHDDLGVGRASRVAFIGEFGRIVRALRPGEQLPLTVLRDGVAKDLTLVIEAASASRQAGIDAEVLLGVRLKEDAALNPTTVIATVLRDSAVAELGPQAIAMLEGSSITGMFGRKIVNVGELGNALETLKGWGGASARRHVELRFRDRNGREHRGYFPLNLASSP